MVALEKAITSENRAPTAGETNPEASLWRAVSRSRTCLKLFAALPSMCLRRSHPAQSRRLSTKEVRPDRLGSSSQNGKVASKVEHNLRAKKTPLVRGFARLVSKPSEPSRSGRSQLPDQTSTTEADNTLMPPEPSESRSLSLSHRCVHCRYWNDKFPYRPIAQICSGLLIAPKLIDNNAHLSELRLRHRVCQKKYRLYAIFHGPSNARDQNDSQKTVPWWTGAAWLLLGGLPLRPFQATSAAPRWIGRTVVD